MQSPPRLGGFSGEAAQPTPTPEGRVGKTEVAVVGCNAGEVLRYQTGVGLNEGGLPLQTLMVMHQSLHSLQVCQELLPMVLRWRPEVL